MKQRILAACLFAILGCQNGSVTSSNGPRSTNQSQLGTRRPGNPARPQLPGTESMMRTGTDANQTFVEASAFCPGSRASVFVRFRKLAEWSTGTIVVENPSKNRSVELYQYNIPPNTEMFDFVEIESQLQKWLQNPDTYSRNDQLVVVGRQLRNNGARETIFETEKHPFEFLDAQFSLEAVSLHSRSEDELQFVAKIRATPRSAPQTTGSYRCLMRSDMSAYLKLSDADPAADEAPLALFVRPESNAEVSIYLTGGEIADVPMSVMPARDIEPFLRTPALKAQWVEPVSDMLEVTLSDEVTVTQ